MLRAVQQRPYDMRKGSAEPIVSHPSINNQEGDWIGNGGDLVFVSKRGEAALGSGSLWRWNADSEEAELLLRVETNFQGAPVVSPHGGTVAYVTDASGSNDLYAVPSRTADGGIQPVRLTHTETDEYFPSWSPDGQRIVYARNGGTPDRERTIDSGMGFALYTVTRGGGEPKPVRIDAYAWSVPTGVVQVHVTESGSQLPSRIYLRGADGLSYFPDTSFPRVASVTEDYYFHTDGSFEVMLPVGQAELEVWRGFEYEPVSRTVNVRAGEVARVEVELTRWIDMAADGWYSGDNHIHPNYGGHEFIMPMDMRNKARAEDLNVALLHGPEQIADLPVPVAESPGAVRIGHPERSHLVEYLAPNSVFNSLPRQRSSPHLRPDDRLVTIDRVLHHASLGVA